MKQLGKLLAAVLAATLLTGCSHRILPSVLEQGTTDPVDIGIPLETREPFTPMVTVPQIELPRFTVPETTAPETTVPETTVPETTVPETTVPDTMVSETAVPEPPVQLRGEEPYRPRYRLGICHALGGSIPQLLFFVDDDSSSWDPDTRNQMLVLFDEADRYLEEQADFWGTELFLEDYQYYTDDRVSIRYSGEFGSYDQAEENEDVMDALAACLNFRDTDEMHRYYQEYFGSRQVIYYVLLNKPGRPYASVDDTDDGRVSMEFVVMYTSYENGHPQVSGAVAHETMHLFGAEDYYDPFGNMPNRLAMAQEKFPDDLMLGGATDAENCTVGPVTAYSVGWLYWPPEEALDPLWWK